jgi:hypothetical protein
LSCSTSLVDESGVELEGRPTFVLRAMCSGAFERRASAAFDNLVPVVSGASSLDFCIGFSFDMIGIFASAAT